jgi:hypothetical protein
MKRKHKEEFEEQANVQASRTKRDKENARREFVQLRTDVDKAMHMLKTKVSSRPKHCNRLQSMRLDN